MILCRVIARALNFTRGEGRKFLIGTALKGKKEDGSFLVQGINAKESKPTHSICGSMTAVIVPNKTSAISTM